MFQVALHMSGMAPHGAEARLKMTSLAPSCPIMPANLTVAAARDATTRSRRIPGVGSPASSTKSQCRSILQRLDNRPVFPTYLAGECRICIKERNWGKCPDVSLYSRMESGVATTTRMTPPAETPRSQATSTISRLCPPS
jgi:hypothetical protein